MFRGINASYPQKVTSQLSLDRLLPETKPVISQHRVDESSPVPEGSVALGSSGSQHRFFRAATLVLSVWLRKVCKTQQERNRAGFG